MLVTLPLAYASIAGTTRLVTSAISASLVTMAMPLVAAIVQSAAAILMDQSMILVMILVNVTVILMLLD
jgi:hypothetical protein